MLELAFWASFLVLGYTFLGYQILMRLLARCVEPRKGQPPPEYPAVTIVLAVYNEEHRISGRVRNLRSLDYEPGKISILLVDDASTDGTVAMIEAENHSDVRVIRNDRKRGKAACLNRAMVEVETELVVFADARQSFAPDALKRLVTNLCDPKVGAVSGALELPRTECGVGESVGLYWRLERALRSDESRWDSCIGCTGAIYGLRSVLFKPIPEDTLLDDVVIPMHAAAQGYRIVYDATAIAVEPQAVTRELETRRKRRTLAGNFQMFMRYPSWLLPWRNRLWWQLISHKYLRVFAPLFLVAMLVSSSGLEGPLYRLAFFGQVGFYMLGAVGLVYPLIKLPFLSIPAGFLFLNLSSLGGFLDHFRNTYRDGWR